MTTVFTDSGLGLDGYMAPFHTPMVIASWESIARILVTNGVAKAVSPKTFYFINDEPERALELARESAA